MILIYTLQYGYTLLHWSAIYNSLDVAALAINTGADVSAKDNVSSILVVCCGAYYSYSLIYLRSVLHEDAYQLLV